MPSRLDHREDHLLLLIVSEIELQPGTKTFTMDDVGLELKEPACG